MPIPPDYTRVNVTWTHKDYDEEEIDFPTEEGDRYIKGVLSSCVLWNKEDIILEMSMPRTNPLEPSKSPSGDDGGGDDDDGGNDNAGGPGSSP
jgi:hypothetical protein